MIRIKRFFSAGGAVAVTSLSLLLLPLSSCFTGVEGTKRIELSREEKKNLTLTAEDTFLNQIPHPTLDHWEKGKVFIISDQRLALLFDNPGNNSSLHDTLSLVGRKLRFEGTDSRLLPDGSREGIILLSDGNITYRLPSGKSPQQMLTLITGSSLPMLIDVDAVQQVDNLLQNKKLWIRTDLWYDTLDNRLAGKKFVPVTVTRVEPGTFVFPLRVILRDESGKKFIQYMNLGNSANESRSFSRLFRLNDPRRNYPTISDPNWERIQNGQVTPGMTKEECRLALGNPTSVDSGHDYSSTIDIWQYDNGVFLRFQDGLLVSIIR